MKTKFVRHKHSNILFFFFILSLLLLGLAFSLSQIREQQKSQTSAAPAPNDCTVSDNDIIMTENEKTLLDAINAYRQEKNVSSLIWNPTLKKPAKWQSNDMMKNNSLSHTDSLGRNTDKRLKDCGLTLNVSWGENLAINTGGAPSEILEMWKNSAPHNKNLLDNSFTQVGLAQSGGYWTFVGSGGIPPTPLPTISGPNPTLLTTPTPTPSMPTPTPNPNSTPTPTPNPNATPTPTPIDQNTTPTPPEENLTPTPTGITVIDMKLKVAIKLPGIGIDGNKTPRTFSRKVLVTVYNLNNQPARTGTGFVTYDGTDLFTGIIHLGTMEEGKYYVKIVVQEQITPDTFQSVTLQGQVDPPFQKLLANIYNVLPPVILKQGDLDNDNALTITDYNLALTCFQAKGCVRDPLLGGTYDRIDFNDDAKVDVVDYNVLLRNYWEYKGN